MPGNQHGRDARATGVGATDPGAAGFRTRQLSAADACGIGAIIGAATILSRPLFSEALFAKDDLIVTAIFLTALMAFSQRSLRDRFGPWRVGIALGLALASKYTVLLVCPLLLFVVDAPFRAGWKWRDFAIAISIAAILAAPWYLRNVIVTGDPLFPADVKLFGARIFTGLFGTERDQQLRTAGGAWRMLSSTYHSLPVPLLSALALMWVLACAAAGHSLLVNPMRRAALLGSMAVFLLFILASPHHEVRYLFPLIVLWFDSATLAIEHWLPKRWMQIVAALLIAGISTATSFDVSLWTRIAGFSASALAIAIVVIGLLLLTRRAPLLRRGIVATFLLAGLLAVYIYWNAYVGLYRDGCCDAWQMRYPKAAPAWCFVRTQAAPAESTVAFANTQFDYPLYGFGFDRAVAYAPTRRGLHSFLDFPRMGDDVPGDLIVKTMTRVMVENPDRTTWLENLRAINARYLLVLRHEMVDDPVELRFAQSDPSHFAVRYSDEFAVVYQIN